MTTVELPTPKIVSRNCDPNILKEGMLKGLHPILARVLASRHLPEDRDLDAVLKPKLKGLSSPTLMADMVKASERVAKAVIQGEVIGLETDHDCDGQTSHAVLYEVLTKHFFHPPEKIRSYIGHRLTEGYGLSEPVAERILKDEPRPTLVITADNGSSDEPRIQQLKAQGIDVIVTDHHAIPFEGYPKSAYACLNPTREDCAYPDSLIAGCMVAWLLMAATRAVLIKEGYLSKDAPKLLDTLDFVAVGTIADCVSIARSHNNRAVVSYGLQLLSKAYRPCWQALVEPGVSVKSEDIAFKIAPLLNSDGRLSSALKSVSFLLSETQKEADDWVYTLSEQNTERKSIQKRITQQGLKQAQELVQKGCLSLSIYLQEGHSGVHGISASRIKDAFGRPTVIFSPKMTDDTLITGSARGIEGVHVRQALQQVHEKYPGLLLAFGGHEGAAGLTLKKDNFQCFSSAFEESIAEQIDANQVGPVVFTDGFIDKEDLNLKTALEINQLEPFGREFEAPIFEAQAMIKHIQLLGDKTHTKLLLNIQGYEVKALWFNCRQSPDVPLTVEVNDRVNIAFNLKINHFRGVSRLELLIVALNQGENEA